MLWLKKIGFENFKDHYLEKDYNDKNLYIWYIEENGKILATMMLKTLEDSVGRIENVCCDIEHRGKGLAKQLLNELFDFSIQTLNLQKLQLGTYERLERAIGFYLKNGFVEKEELRNSTTHARHYEMRLN